jgi:hypothetical protein
MSVRSVSDWRLSCSAEASTSAAAPTLPAARLTFDGPVEPQRLGPVGDVLDQLRHLADL